MFLRENDSRKNLRNIKETKRKKKEKLRNGQREN